MPLTRRRFISALAGGALTGMAPLAGCVEATGLTRQEAIGASDIVADLEFGQRSIRFVVASDPTAVEETCMYNPATKTTMCSDSTIDATIGGARLVLPDATLNIAEERDEYVFNQVSYADGEYVAGFNVDGHGWTRFGFDIEDGRPAPESFFVDEVF